MFPPGVFLFNNYEKTVTLKTFEVEMTHSSPQSTMRQKNLFSMQVQSERRHSGPGLALPLWLSGGNVFDSRILPV